MEAMSASKGAWIPAFAGMTGNVNTA
jgi:hypothetical protein